MKGESEREGSIPVQSRIDVRVLAALDIYWSGSGYEIRSMSQLVSWSLRLLQEVLKNNEMLPKEIETVVEAHKHMEMRGLYQPSMKKKGFQKLGAALRFESMRMEGVDPANVVPGQYRMLHRDTSVKNAPDMEELMRTYREIEAKEKEEK